MSDNYYSDDDYDQEYAEGYSAYKYDNEDYDSEYEDGYEDDPEYAEEEYVDDYIDECLDDADYDVSNQESIQAPHKERLHMHQRLPLTISCSVLLELHWDMLPSRTPPSSVVNNKHYKELRM